MIRSFGFCLFALLCALPLSAREFTVLVYNVENLFDADGVAVYGDYQVAPFNAENPYTPARFLTKLENITRVVSEVNNGAGPEVILFQEFELDRTPFNDGKSNAEVLADVSKYSVRELLTTEFSPRVADLSALQLLLKLFEETGLTGYTAVTIDPFATTNHTAHCNVVFTRFPVASVAQRELESARDLQFVELDVEGHPFYLLNNHWKSGASSKRTASARLQNAAVVREELDRLLRLDVSADVLIAGDLNSHYNQAAVFPEWGPVGINNVLESEINEAGLLAGSGPILYNLWGELPLEERGSEVYRGKWGTLMQMLITRGLYDNAGIQYVDNSFFRLAIPGVNVDPVWGQPISWSNLGDGHGFSDHLPVGARFRTTDAGDRSTFVKLVNPTRELRLPAHQPVVDYRKIPDGVYPSATVLQSLSEAQRLPALGRLFQVEAVVPPADQRGLIVGDKIYGVYLPTDEVKEAFGAFREGRRVRFLAEFGVFRGQEQFIIQDASWVGR